MSDPDSVTLSPKGPIDVKILNGDGDGPWEVLVSGRKAIVTVEGGKVVGARFEDAEPADEVGLGFARETVVDFMEFFGACKGFGSHPDVVM